MIVCANCKHKNMAGAVFCSECGSQIFGTNELVTQNISTDSLNNLGKKPTGSLTGSLSGADAWASLHLLDTGQVLPLSSRNEFTMGRISEGQPIMPDIDLSPYQAYAAGVSRLHAVIKRQGSQIILMDLGSANGTYVNGKRLSSNTEHSLNHGDIVALGKLKMQVLVNNS
jgi:pSer/pThr/pTyr-binding forkhead associated (FHA) protein